MEASNEVLISLLASKELELKEMHLYIRQLESSYNDLAIKYNKLLETHYAKKKRSVVGFKQNQ